MKLVRFPNVRVLVIDDEPVVRIFIKKVLQSIGCAETREAVDGTVALTMLAGAFRPDLVICDVRMVPMDGLTFLGHLRGSAPPVRADLPVIMLTAVGERKTALDTVNLGISGYLLKPVTPTQLADRINTILGAAADAAAGVRQA